MVGVRNVVSLMAYKSVSTHFTGGASRYGSGAAAEVTGRSNIGKCCYYHVDVSYASSFSAIIMSGCIHVHLCMYLASLEVVLHRGPGEGEVMQLAYSIVGNFRTVQTFV